MGKMFKQTVYFVVSESLDKYFLSRGNIPGSWAFKTNFDEYIFWSTPCTYSCAKKQAKDFFTEKYPDIKSIFVEIL